MATKIQIINRALVKIGSATLTSEADDNKAGRAVRAVYDGVLDRVLRAYRWSFAIKRTKLAALSDPPEYGYALQYQLPSDWLRTDRIGPYLVSSMNDPLLRIRPPYQIEGGKILTDMEAPLFLRYGARIIDPTQYDACFCEALSCLLAVELCEPITQSSTKKQGALQDLDVALKEARAVSAIERPPIPQQETSWVTARL